ncbi:MAG: hypothetical protein KDA75_08580, partial [Planctomycetaceae bacterium]|nr:hypothetical protein [Planctomycetaceae bacterium]
NVWTADLPILSTDQPLFALANVHYRLSRPETAPHAPPTMQFALTSLLQTAPPDELRLSAVVATDAPSPVIDDFARGWKDWYTLSPDNPHHWEYSTRKLNDPKWRGRPGDTLMLELRAEQSNELVIILTENFFRPYRGPSRENIAVAKLSGGQKETLALLPADFQTAAGEPLSSWDQIDLLSLRAYHKTEGRTLGSTNWAGPQPQFLKLYWERR